MVLFYCTIKVLIASYSLAEYKAELKGFRNFYTVSYQYMQKINTTFLKKVDCPKRPTFGAVLKNDLELPPKESLRGCPLSFPARETWSLLWWHNQKNEIRKVEDPIRIKMDPPGWILGPWPGHTIGLCHKHPKLHYNFDLQHHYNWDIFKCWRGCWKILMKFWESFQRSWSDFADIIM